MAELQRQDGIVMRAMLGIEQDADLPAPVLDKYFQIQRMCHRLNSGPLETGALLLVLDSSKAMDLVAEGNGEPVPEEEDAPDDEENAPGLPLPNGALIVEGREYYVFKNGWRKSRYICKAPHGKMRFEGPDGNKKKFVIIQPYHVRLIE